MQSFQNRLSGRMCDVYALLIVLAMAALTGALHIAIPYVV